MNFLLFIIATILFIPLSILNFMVVGYKRGFWNALDKYFRETALDIDRFGNRNFRTLFNLTLIVEEGSYRFGTTNETISSVLGRNKLTNTLSKTGRILANILDWIDENHCIKSIGY